MANLFKRPQSPFWWIRYRRALTGERRAESTRLRYSVPLDTRRARELQAELTLKERRSSGVVSAQRWDRWVLPFLNQTYAHQQNTLKAYLTAWHALNLFLVQKEIWFPGQLTKQHCLEYAAWRKQAQLSAGKYKASHNTAIYDLRILAIIMREAVARDFAAKNPCRELRLRREPTRRVRPAFDAADIALVRDKIESEPEPRRTFLRVSFEIARYQGCRVTETYLNPQTDVQLNGEIRTITFRAKGGKDHTAPLHPALVPLFQQLQVSGAVETYPKPKSHPGSVWYCFLKRIGLKDKKPGICIHSARVTVATELARANVHEAKARKYLGHATAAVHQIYQRLGHDDLGEALNAIK